MKVKGIIVCFLILCFGFISYLVLNDKTILFDSFIYNLFLRNDFLTYFFKFITFFASEIAIIIMCLIFILINPKSGFFVSLNAVNILVLNVCLKLIFMRERPLNLMIISESGYSFPSGHAMGALGFYGFIIYLINYYDFKGKKLLSILLSILIILIGLSRIYLGVHYASDVIAGYIISLAYLIIYTSLFKRSLK